MCVGEWRQVNLPNASGFLSLSARILCPLHSVCWFLLLTFKPLFFQLILLYVFCATPLLMSVLEEGVTLPCWDFSQWKSTVLSRPPDTSLFCSKGLFMKQERVHVRIVRVHLCRTQWEKLYRQTGPGCWGRCLALLFCLYSNKSKLTCVVIGVEQQVQKNNSAANSNERVRLIPSGRYWEDNRGPCQQLN